MLNLSTADGFMSVKEGVDDMIKYLANEPSVGLYFVQQHSQASMPFLLDVKEKVVEKVRDVSLHTEDVEDSIDVVRSMTEFGYPLADKMIKEINTSLLIISKRQPKRGLIQSTAWGHQPDTSSSNAGAVSLSSSNNSVGQDSQGNWGYISTVLSSAKQKAAGLRRINQPSTFDRRILQSSPQSPFAADASAPSAAEAEELPLPSSLEIGETMMTEPSDNQGSHERQYYLSQDYNKFNIDKEANFEAWLQDSEDQYKFLKHHD